MRMQASSWYEGTMAAVRRVAPRRRAARLAESARAARRAFAEAFVKHAIPALEAATGALWRAVATACLRVRRAP